MDDEIHVGDEIYASDEIYAGDKCGCGSGCASGCKPCSKFWVRGDYLLWWTKGMWTPPLVTTSPAGTIRDDAGVLGKPGTSILFGDEDLFEEARWGSRLRVGWWLDSCQQYGVEGEYFALVEETDLFQRRSDGDPILARPFHNAFTDKQDSELIAYPGLVRGGIVVDTSTELESAGVRMRINRRKAGSFCGNGGGCGARLDFLVGYRYMQLSDELAIREGITARDPRLLGAQLNCADVFDTENEFHGGELGFLLEVERCRWSLELLAKVALGNTRKAVWIDGDTAITVQGQKSYHRGGILAQRTNIGQYEDNDFAVVPEVGITLAYQLTKRLRATVNYSFIHWNDVARPGEQIDLDVNENLFPPEAVPFRGPLRPAFAFHDTDYWAQGLGFGVDYRW